MLASSNVEMVQALRGIPGINHVESSGLRLDINASQNPALRSNILQEALKHQAQILSFGPRETSLEDILLRLVQTDASDIPEPKQDRIAHLKSFLLGGVMRR